MEAKLLEWAQALADSQVGTTIAESSWIFPALEVLHVIGLAIVVGTIAVVDLRLLSLASKHRSVRELTDETLPYTYAGFAIALTSGVLMFISNAVTYFENTPFRVKLILLAVAGINIVFFHYVTYRNVETWDRDTRTPAAAQAAGAMSLLTWVVIVGLGRWIAFV